MKKGIRPYEYIDDWEKFNETSLPRKGNVYSHLDIGNITDAARKKSLYIFWNKQFRRISWFVCSMQTLLLADVFENVRNLCLKIYELDPAKFLSPPGLAWQTDSKTTIVKLDVLTDIDMLIMVETGIRWGLCHSIYWYAKSNNN